MLVTETVPVALPAAAGVNVTVRVAFWPGLTVAGRLRPLVAKPAPDADAAEIVSAPVPVLLRVTDCEAVVPTATLAKLTLVGLTVSCGCAVAPVPLSAITNEGFAAVLVTVTLPLTAPDAVGVKITGKVVDSPPVSVSGAEIPLTANALPLTATCDIEMLEVPVFLSVTVWLELLPITTLPNATLDGLALNAAPDASPVPDRVSVVGDPEALLTKLMLPLALPPAVGANCTEKVLLWLAASVKGVDSPDMLNAEPERLALVIVSEALPLLVNVTLWVEFPPTETVPNANVAGETDKPGAVPVPARATETVPFVALLVTDKVPLRLPACCGANWI